MAVDGYTQVYDAAETSEVTVDLIVSIGAALVSFGTLIGLVVLYVWVKKKV
jgi:hypothetical protein